MRSTGQRLKRRWIGGLGVLAVLITLVVGPHHAPASVEEQRKRLPPPAQECADPVAGIWLGHELLRNRWYRFSLFIERVTPGEPELEGHIESHSWDGGPEQSSPPPCVDDDHTEFIVDMPATGRFENNHIEFTGQSWTLRQNICRSLTGIYYPDGFSGDLIEHGTEFHSLSDDGFNPVVPVVFRRIKCEELDRPVPELPPPRRPSVGGCGCF